MPKNYFKIEPKRKSSRLLQQEEAFMEAVRGLVKSLGGQPLEEEPNRYAIQTCVGRLEICPYPEFIACRFDDVERASRVLDSRMNPHSGKWNFGQGMLWDKTAETRPEAEAQILDDFQRELSSLAVGGPVDPPSGRFTVAGLFRQMARNRSEGP